MAPSLSFATNAISRSCLTYLAKSNQSAACECTCPFEDWWIVHLWSDISLIRSAVCGLGITSPPSEDSLHDFRMSCIYICVDINLKNIMFSKQWTLETVELLSIFHLHLEPNWNFFQPTFRPPFSSTFRELLNSKIWEKYMIMCRLSSKT